MKLFIFVLFLMFCGCDQLLQGQEQPVKLIKNNQYVTNCGGAVETWGSCNDKAQKTCQGNYSVIKKTENSTGTNRELIFECNKKQ